MTEYHDHRDDCPFKFATLDACDCVEKNMLDRIEALTDELAIAKWLLTDAAVQLEAGKIKTRRNRAGLIWQFLDEIKGESHE